MRELQHIGESDNAIEERYGLDTYVESIVKDLPAGVAVGIASSKVVWVLDTPQHCGQNKLKDWAQSPDLLKRLNKAKCISAQRTWEYVLDIDDGRQEKKCFHTWMLKRRARM